MSIQKGDLVRIAQRNAHRNQEVLLVTTHPKMIVHVDENGASHELLAVEVLGKAGPALLPINGLERVEKGKRK